MWSRIRRWSLIYALVLVAGSTWLGRHRLASWEEPLWVVVHPINGDGSAISAAFIRDLQRDAFKPIDRFMQEQAAHHGVDLARPVQVILGDEVLEQPPLPAPRAGVLEVMLWSLRLRWWAWRVDRGEQPPPAQVQVFVRYFDPDPRPTLGHSLGLREGLIGVVNAFATPRQVGSNHVVIAHEIMHTLGAADRYDPATGQPAWPDGYAEPYADPRYPQVRAELMGGRIPRDSRTSSIPRSLGEVIIGRISAEEIGWREK